MLTLGAIWIGVYSSNKYKKKINEFIKQKQLLSDSKDKIIQDLTESSVIKEYKFHHSFIKLNPLGIYSPPLAA